MKNFSLPILILVSLVTCSDNEESDPRQNPIPRDFDYYEANPAQADAQRAICAEIPSQARSVVLEGNCVAADGAWRLRR